MQFLRRPALSFSVINRQFVRSVSVHSTVVNNKEKSTNLKSWREIPGPSTLPLIGQFHHFLPGGSLYKIDNAGLVDLMYERYGPIVKFEGSFGSPTLIFLYDPEAISHILRSENLTPIRVGFQTLDYFRNNYNKERDPNKSTGLLTEHGERWKTFRSTVNPIMLQPKTIKLYKNSLNEVAEDMIKRMKLIRNDKNMLEAKFDEEMNLWALESIGVVALGGRINCLDRNLPENSPEKKLIHTIHQIFHIVDELDFKPSLWRYVTTPGFKKAMKLYENQVELSKFFIGKAIKQLENKNKNSNEEKAVLEKLLEIDENVALIMASDMLFAGVDTVLSYTNIIAKVVKNKRQIKTNKANLHQILCNMELLCTTYNVAANTMTATLYLLAKNPEKQEKLREEIMSRNEKQPYLKACIKESMRMLPVASGNLRKTTRDYEVLGYRIPKDMLVTFAHQFLSVQEDQFPRSKEYIPERWTAEKSDPLYYGNAHPFAFSPFGFGSRSCIGRRIADLEIETFLAKVIENFHVEWFGPDIKVKQTTLNYIIGPYNFVFKDVK